MKAIMYEHVMKYLSEHGFEQYEMVMLNIIIPQQHLLDPSWYIAHGFIDDHRTL